MLLPVIMAGGSGTRLWPLSRREYPKQFLSLTTEAGTLLQATLQRLSGLTTKAPLLVCHESHRFIMAEQLRQLAHDYARIVLEPDACNTAPGLAAAALAALQGDDDPLLLVLPADHHIDDVPAFKNSVRAAQPLAEQGYLVTFGIVPERAETGYGYIRRGEKLPGEGFTVSAFVEKPDAATAETFVASGDYSWNSGMFLIRASRYLSELKRLRPDIHSACQIAYANASQDMDFLRLDAQAYAGCPAESIDHAVMETTANAAVVPLKAGWNDIGSWQSLWQLGPHDESGNVLNGDVEARDCHNGYFYSQGPLVTTLGVDNLAVIATPDAVLVADRCRGQELQALVARMHKDGRKEVLRSPHVYRPWGHYRVLNLGERYQVKCISVHPEGKLSLQRHYHRAEHWVVVSGIARVTLEDQQFLVTENESTYIPVGKVHSLENPGSVPLELIEVQSGSYLGEDDIVRISDIYGRASH